jgi:hypothetical protein
VAGSFQALGELGQLGGHLARDAGADARRVERERVGPQGAQPRADGGIGQLRQADAVAARIGKRGVGGAAAGELGIKLDHVAHIDHHHKRRAALSGGQGAGVVLGLLAGFEQGTVKRLARRHAAGLGRDAGLELLALPHKMPALVAIDPPGAAGAVAMAEGDRALELVMRLVAGRLDTEQRTELNHEALRGGQLGGGDAAPFADEGLGGGGVLGG